jgi:hypothetical protein
MIFLWDATKTFNCLSNTDNYIVIIIMKNSIMQIPPLSQLFKQKQDYNAHK